MTIVMEKIARINYYNYIAMVRVSIYHKPLFIPSIGASQNEKIRK